MNETQKKRLFDVAKACREAPDPKQFNMGLYFHNCGTPSCAIGHYAAREDLHSGAVVFVNGVILIRRSSMWSIRGQEYFGIALRELNELFEATGCGRTWDEETQEYGPSITNNQAAEYIEAFVARKEAEAKPAS